VSPTTAEGIFSGERLQLLFPCRRLARRLWHVRGTCPLSPLVPLNNWENTRHMKFR
ncbi:hypothetical protein L9F63_011660, partial [Diploptera punctata]